MFHYLKHTFSISIQNRLLGDDLRRYSFLCIVRFLLNRLPIHVTQSDLSFEFYVNYVFDTFVLRYSFGLRSLRNTSTGEEKLEHLVNLVLRF